MAIPGERFEQQGGQAEVARQTAEFRAYVAGLDEAELRDLVDAMMCELDPFTLESHDHYVDHSVMGVENLQNHPH